MAVARLAEAARVSDGALSVGLEPAPAYLPRGFEPTIAGYERFLGLMIKATAGIAAAYKFNLAFFEALGPPGIDLLYRVRAALPAGAFIIADAKRGDIGTTAEHYARALFESLGADAATVNPLMGRDSAEPFLAYGDKLTFFLVLTSNPGSRDFLIPGGLYRRIAEHVVLWNSRGNCGFVVGATQPNSVGELRAVAGAIPFLIPGIGAQGGELEEVARHSVPRNQTRHGVPGCQDGFPGMLFHVTRGVLPGKDEAGDAGEVIRAKALSWRDRINVALAAAPSNRSPAHAHR